MAAAPHWSFAPFRLDPDNACMWCGAAPIALRPKAFALLHHLVTHAGQLVTKEALLEAVWPETAVSDTVLKDCIHELRQTLGDTARTPRFIATVPRRGYRFVAPVTVVGPAEIMPAEAHPLPLVSCQPSQRMQSTRAMPALVEREAVCRQLQAWLEQAQQGKRQVVFVTGETGIGKTAVVEAFVAQAATARRLHVAWGQCVEQYGPGEAYLPVLEALGQLCRAPGNAPMRRLLRQYAPTWLAQIPWLLSADERDSLQHEILGVTRERMLRELAAWIEALTAETPLLLVLEDLHWSDYATLDLIAILARRREAARLLLLGTYRPVDVLVREHPLRHQQQRLHWCTACPYL